MRRRMLRWISLLLLIISLTHLVSCKKETVDMTSYPLEASLESVKLWGRCSVVEGGVSCDFTASGIEFIITAVGAVELKLSVTADTYFTVWIDGVRQDMRYYVPVGTQQINIAEFSEQETHRIRILKQTEAQNSLSVLHALLFNGRFEQKPEERKWNIEFLGDSISCGHGNLCGNDVSNSGIALYEDGTQGYAFLAAEALDADCSVIGCSGIGVAKGYQSFYMDTFFVKESYYRSDSLDHTIVKIPDIVVINLGTNDQTSQANSEEMVERVKALIVLIRERYGNVPIIWAHGMMMDGMKQEISKAISELNGEDANLYLCELPQNASGGGGHPDLEAHKAAAEKLQEFIESKCLLPIR